MRHMLLTLALLLGISSLSVEGGLLSIGSSAKAQVPYGYAPQTNDENEMTSLGGNKNGFVQGLTLFDPSDDAVLQRLKGKEIRGVRCYLRAEYKQARQKRSAIIASVGKTDNIVRTQYTDFEKGWNDVLFDEPLVIGDEPLYIGVQVYETIGTPYPLVAYNKAVVPQSCWINLGKKTWEEITDRGTLLTMLLLDDDAAPAMERTAYAQNTTHPQTVAPDRDFTGGLYIHNFSSAPISSIEVAMQGEGAESPTLRTIELSTPIGAYGGTVVQAALRAGNAQGTSVDWTATVTQINGEATQAGRPGTTKLYVTQDNFIRTPLIEEFTSQRCVNCPQMAYFLDKALEEYEGDYVYVSHHTGFVEDVFTTQPDREILYVFGGYENEYNPAIMYNRAILDGESKIIQGVRDMSPTPYLEALEKAYSMAAMAEVNVEQRNGEVRVSGRVAHDLVGTPLYLSCYLLEDGISTKDYFQKGMDDEDAPADLDDVFRHNGVILHYFTKEAIGDLLTTDDKGMYDIAYPAVTKKGFGGTRRRLVAFIHKVDKANLRENIVLNATQTWLDSDGIDETISRPTSDGTARDGGWFDLSGRKVSQPNKGLYIRNGQKFLVK